MSASGLYGNLRACAGIVGHVDLRLGSRAGAVFDAQIAAGNGRFKGIRHQTGWDADPGIRNVRTDPTPELTRDKTWRAGFAELAKRGLTFDAWLYHPQLAEIADLADAFPGTTIVLDHIGGPLGYAGYAGHHDEVRAAWKRSMADLAKRQNIVVKVGGLGMAMGWFDFYRQPSPPSSQALADAFRPWVETCIDLFGPDRCMFESNFPVDKITSGYGVLWNAFKRLASSASAASWSCATRSRATATGWSASARCRRARSCGSCTVVRRRWSRRRLQPGTTRSRRCRPTRACAARS